MRDSARSMWRGAVVAVAACALAAGAAVAQDGKTEDGADAIVGVWRPPTPITAGPTSR
jgi:hypothetical protein